MCPARTPGPRPRKRLHRPAVTRQRHRPGRGRLADVHRTGPGGGQRRHAGGPGAPFHRSQPLPLWYGAVGGVPGGWAPAAARAQAPAEGQGRQLAAGRAPRRRGPSTGRRRRQVSLPQSPRVRCAVKAVSVAWPGGAWHLPRGATPSSNGDWWGVGQVGDLPSSTQPAPPLGLRLPRPLFSFRGGVDPPGRRGYVPADCCTPHRREGAWPQFPGPCASYRAARPRFSCPRPAARIRPPLAEAASPAGRRR
jgi:hypothetical protein